MPAEPPVAVVTGASDGIGRVIALHLADIGYRVVAAARSTEKLVALAKETDVHRRENCLDVAL